MNKWFDIDKSGLAKLLERKGKQFVLFELIQNAWDERGVTKVSVRLYKKPGTREAFLQVVDDAPTGFEDLAHAFTLFAESGKKSDAEKRGRFNLGEKLVLALCSEASIVTTTGAVYFRPSGERKRSGKTTTASGSVFEAHIKMTADEVVQVSAAVKTLLAPADRITTFNGERLESRTPIERIPAKLATEIGDEEGILRRTTRETAIEVYPVRDGEEAAIYELGIPIVTTGDKYHYNILQKVPLTIDRENVPPSFLKSVRVAVLNVVCDTLAPDDFRENWAGEAIQSPDAKPETINAFLDGRFGLKRVAYDPSDPEANKIAVSEGYTVVHGASLSKQAWENVRNAEALQPAGKVTPSHKAWDGEDDPNAETFTDWIPFEKWTDGMKLIAEYAKLLGRHLMNKEVEVKYCSTTHHSGAASYGGQCLTFNKLRLGKEWFERGITIDVDSLIIHEFGHEYSGDHLSADYYKALTDLGAKLKHLALDKPALFKKFLPKS